MDAKRALARRTVTARAAAVLEVAMATALVLAAYKALKLVEPAGQNFAPGAVMVVAATGLGWFGRRDGVALGVDHADLALQPGFRPPGGCLSPAA